MNVGFNFILRYCSLTLSLARVSSELCQSLNFWALSSPQSRRQTTWLDSPGEAADQAVTWGRKKKKPLQILSPLIVKLNKCDLDLHFVKYFFPV